MDQLSTLWTYLVLTVFAIGFVGKWIARTRKRERDRAKTESQHLVPFEEEAYQQWLLQRQHDQMALTKERVRIENLSPKAFAQLFSFTALMIAAVWGQEYHDPRPDDFRAETPASARLSDPEFNLDTLEGDRLRAYYATWNSLNVIYRGVVPQLITMSDYWRANYQRQVSRYLSEDLKSRSRGAVPNGPVYIQFFRIRSLKITQILYNTVFLHVTGYVTFSDTWRNFARMEWDMGFEDIRSAQPKLTVFWETSAHQMESELSRMGQQERVGARARDPLPEAATK
jgi:hypothetical protein